MQHRANEIEELKSEIMHQSFSRKLRGGGQTLHMFCKGSGHCDCQHKPVGEGNIQNGS